MIRSRTDRYQVLMTFSKSIRRFPLLPALPMNQGNIQRSTFNIELSKTAGIGHWALNGECFGFKGSMREQFREFSPRPSPDGSGRPHDSRSANQSAFDLERDGK